MRSVWLVAAALALGCDGASNPASSPAPVAPPTLTYLVHNQLWSIGLDGSNPHRLATVGDDARRTGFGRRLPDGRLALLADDTGAIYPYVADTVDGPYVADTVDDGTTFHRVGPTNVTYHDALCGVGVGGVPTVVYTVTPYAGGRTALVRLDPTRSASAAFVALEPDGEVTEPSPWDDSAVLAVRNARGAVTVEILAVDGSGTRQVLTTLDWPYQAHAPARLSDGRVVFIRTDPRDSTDTAIGELFVLERGGALRTTGLTGVLALVVVGDQVVYEAGGADGVSDLIRSDLVNPPVNLTRTKLVSEHLGWSD
jgi:hypothetical protein